MSTGDRSELRADGIYSSQYPGSTERTAGFALLLQANESKNCFLSSKVGMLHFCLLLVLVLESLLTLCFSLLAYEMYLLNRCISN